MDYEQINLTIEELEKRLKYLKKDGNSNLNSLSTQLASLQTNYTNLNSQVSTNTSAISSLQTTASANSGNITSLQTTTSSHTSQIEDLDERVETLENSGGSDSSQNETFNCFNYKDFPMNLDTFGNHENFFTCFFTCDTNAYVKLKMKFQIEINNAEERTKTLNVYLNDQIIDTHSYTVNGNLSDTYTVEHIFMPTQKNNNILYKSTETSASKRYCRVKLLDCKIEIHGRNVEILNHQNDFKVFLSQNKYYITRNAGSTATYKIINIGETDISTDFLNVPRPVYDYDDPLATGTDKYNYTYFNYQILPVINFNSQTNLFEIDNSDLYVVGVTNIGYAVNKALLSTVPKHGTAMTKLSYSGEYSVSSPGSKKGDNGYEIDTLASNTYAVKERGTHYLIFTNSVTNSSTTPIYTMTLNNEAIPNKWVHNEAVFAKDWQTTPNRHYACVATNEFGENYFFAEREATYNVFVGEGSQCSAYYQADGSINVYLCKANKIYKHVLTFNSSTNKYELSSSNYVMDALAYLEGNSTDYFYKKGETWFYVSPTV